MHPGMYGEAVANGQCRGSSQESESPRLIAEGRLTLGPWALLDSNQGPTDYESAALTD